MNDLITAIKAWPIIVQGALGSGLFWLILVLLQKISLKITGYLSHLFKESEKSEIRTELLKILMTEAAGIEKLNYAACSGQLNPDTWLGRTSAFAGVIPSLC